MFQIKKNIIILLALVTLSEFTNANSNSRNQIIIDISEQRLYLFEKDVLKHSFPVSAKLCGGSIENSFKTPLGSHQIKEKIELMSLLTRYLLLEKIQAKSQYYQ